MGCSRSQPEVILQKVTNDGINLLNSTQIKRIKKNFQSVYANSIADYYTILQAIGSGSIGTLFYAKHIKEGQYRTLREINKLCMFNEMNTIGQEVNILKDLDHPNVLKVYEVIETSRNIYVSLEHINGCSLSEKVKSPGCETLLAKIMLDVLSALCYLHAKGIAHCTLCPEYIVQSGSGYDITTKIIGFSAAQRLNDKTEVNLKKIRYQYASPELLKGDFNEKTDL